MIQTFNYVNSNSLTRPLVVQPISTRANDICGYYFKEKGAAVPVPLFIAIFAAPSPHFKLINPGLMLPSSWFTIDILKYEL